MTTEKGIAELELPDQEEGQVEGSEEEGTTATQTQETSEEEPDYKSLYEQEKAQREQAEADRQKVREDARAQRIAQLTQQQRDQRQEQIVTMLDKLLERHTDGELDSTQLRAEVKKGIAEVDTQVADAEQVSTLADDYEGFLPDVRKAGIEGESLKKIAKAYNDGVKDYNSGDFKSAQVNLALAKTEFELAKLRKESSNGRPSAASMRLNAQNSAARGVGSSDQAWLDNYADEEHGGVPPTPENTKRAAELIAKGLRARPRHR